MEANTNKSKKQGKKQGHIFHMHFNGNRQVTIWKKISVLKKQPDHNIICSRIWICPDISTALASQGLFRGRLLSQNHVSHFFWSWHKHMLPPWSPDMPTLLNVSLGIQQTKQQEQYRYALFKSHSKDYNFQRLRAIWLKLMPDVSWKLLQCNLCIFKNEARTNTVCLFNVGDGCIYHWQNDSSYIEIV